LREKHIEAIRGGGKARSGLIVGAAIGIGMTAQAAERGGADFLLALNAGRLRVMGTSSLAALLPLHDANAFTDGFARREILGRVAVPVVLGVCAHSVRDVAAFFEECLRSGYAGIANFPSVTHLDGRPRQALEDAGLGFAAEARTLAAARRAGLVALGYARTREEVSMLMQGGIDILCLNFGWTAASGLGTRSGMDVAEATDRTRRLLREVRISAPDTLCLVEGGPLVSPEQVWQVCAGGKADGYIGGSTLDRLPLEAAVAQSTAAFKMIALTGAEPEAAARRARRLSGLVGASDAMRAVVAQVVGLGPSGRAVLVVGESGSGRTAVARAIHATSGRRRLALLGPGEAPPTASDTTLLVEEVDTWPVGAQALLMARIDEDGGTSRGRVVATLRAGGEAAMLPALRERLEPGRIALTPLRDRPEDIPALVTHILRRLPLGRAAELAPEALRLLLARSWPGNVRELRALVERAALHAHGPRLEPQDLAMDMGDLEPTAPADERAWILDALRRHRFRRGEAAAFMGISRKTLYNRMRKLGMLI